MTLQQIRQRWEAAEKGPDDCSSWERLCVFCGIDTSASIPYRACPICSFACEIM